MNLDTVGIREFEAAYNAQTYPGLGVVKKYSIMHHLELMSRYLDGVAKCMNCYRIWSKTSFAVFFANNRIVRKPFVSVILII